MLQFSRQKAILDVTVSVLYPLNSMKSGCMTGNKNREVPLRLLAGLLGETYVRTLLRNKVIAVPVESVR